VFKKLDGNGEGMGSVGNTIWSFHGRQVRGSTIKGCFFTLPLLFMYIKLIFR